MRNNQPVTNQEVTVPPSANILSTTNPKGVISHINEDFLKISGFERDELIGQAHNIVRHPDMPPTAFQMLWTALKSKRSWMGIVKNRCKNGDHYWVDAYATPIIKDGEVEELQSIRVKAKEEYVERAEALYQKLQSGKTPGFLKRAQPNLLLKVLGLVGAGVFLGVVLSHWLLGGSMIAAELISLVSIAGGLVWLLSPLKTAIDNAKNILDDPVAMHVYTGRSDEAGQLILAMKALQSETGGIIGRVSEDAHKLVDSNVTMSAAVQQSSSVVRQLHQETDAVATAINEMSASIQEVATNTSLTAGAAEDANKEAIQSRQVVTEAKDSIQSLASEVTSASDVIGQLEQDSEAINTVVDVIRSVAEQTNLLALNAAIEAARAGEQGRGFAVVADEVRTLATRTHNSTEEIMQMIDRLQVGAKNAVSNMGVAQEKAQASVEEVERVSDSISVISDAMDNIKNMSTQVAAAVEEQSLVAEEVNRNITQVVTYSNEISECMDSSEKISAEVKGLAENLKQLALQFWQRKAS